MDAFARLKRKNYIILSFALLFSLTLGFRFGDVQAQTIPTFKPSLPSGHAVALPGNPATPKPQIPYLEELRQIQSLKQSYDSLKTQLKRLKEISQDSTDSAVVRARSKVVLEREKQLLEDMVARDDVPDAELNAAIANTLSDINRSGQTLETASSVAEIEHLMDTSEENLKALINEWVMPKIEQHLSGTLDQGWDPVPGKVPDYFGSGGHSLLETDGDSAEEILALARKHVAGKGRHISDEYLKNADRDFRKLKIDSLGYIQVTKFQNFKQKSAFFEPNTLAGKSWQQRTGLYIWYDPLTPFGEGVHIASGVSYGFSPQVRVFAGGVVRSHFSKESWPRREGVGVSLGMRVSKRNWAVQAMLTGCEVAIQYPKGNENLNYGGKILSSTVSVGRRISMGSKAQSIVLVGIDPLYRKEKSLTGSAVQISMGFELERLSKSKKESGK